MSHIIVELVQIHIASVEIEERVIGVLFYGVIIVLFSFLQFTNVVIGKTTVVVVETVRLNLDGFCELVKSLFPVFFLEIGESKIVMSTCFIISVLNRLLQVFNRRLQSP